MKKAVFLFDTTGYAAQPFTEAGWETYIIDIKNVGEYAVNSRATHVLNWNILDREDDIVELARGAEFVFGFPPCTDLAVSGAAHFAKKLKADPLCQVKAVHLAQAVQRIAEKAGAPWALENPVSVMATMWRASDFRFHPWHYGGYLRPDDVHPDYPAQFPPQDRYPKTTCIWKGNGFKLPQKNPAKPPTITANQQNDKRGGKSELTKRIRSSSPRGFFRGLYEVYK
jgi:hypothetical protein